jgi:hypothetical protein
MDGNPACTLSRDKRGKSTQEYGKTRSQENGVPVEKTTLCSCATRPKLETGERRLKKGLKERQRTVVLFEDETILTERPPLRASWALVGEQAKVSITGNRGKRVLYGVLNPKSGKLVTAIDEKWNQWIFQIFLNKIRNCFRG